MVTLKQLHENFIDEQIRENYFLNTLFEAIDAKQITRVADSIDKLEVVAEKFQNKVLDAAMLDARKDAKLVATARAGTQETIIANLIGFYSKITNFLKVDLPALKRVNLKDFFSASTDPGAKLIDDLDAKNIKKVLRMALTTDSFFGKILGRFGLTSQKVSAVPYLKIENFIQNFMTTPKSELETNINAVIAAVGGLEGDPTKEKVSAEGSGGEGSGEGGGGGGGTGGAPAGAGGGAPAGAGGGAPAGNVDKTQNAVTAFDKLIGDVISQADIADLTKEKIITANGGEFLDMVFQKNKKFFELLDWVKKNVRTT